MQEILTASYMAFIGSQLFRLRVPLSSIPNTFGIHPAPRLSKLRACIERLAGHGIFRGPWIVPKCPESCRRREFNSALLFRRYKPFVSASLKISHSLPSN
jgi:hypothetical protein